ncbi:uncharacterized protein N7479_008548 [Penicillium vulpinum]|uniref:uncharacterized protein n=1 Tax=Penicillium vulpinum TaxID=29845 RepID=UPI0025479449|nr:uncharacterized protein N7479_008548 [Penicillium vulpinum]KAJ5950135.1 hypothetical protein N7479_008548 [Penicillium vulpinum]
MVSVIATMTTPKSSPCFCGSSMIMLFFTYLTTIRMPMGAVPAYQIIIAWVANSFPGPLIKQSAAIAIANMIGNTASIYGNYMWPFSSGPRYVSGGSATAAIAFLVAFVALVIRLVHVHMNKRLDETELSMVIHPFNSTDLETRAVGFRYILSSLSYR